MFSKQADFQRAAVMMQQTAPLVEAGILPTSVLEKLYGRLYKAAGYKDFAAIEAEIKQARTQGVQSPAGGVQGAQAAIGAGGGADEVAQILGAVGGGVQ